MKRHQIMACFSLIGLLIGQSAPCRGEEEVTISKSRLRELEQKEQELEKLKAERQQTRGDKARLEKENSRLKKEAEQLQKAQPAAGQKAGDADAADVEGVGVVHTTPPMETLPPLKRGEIVDAKDLMNHYLGDARAAAGRYEAQRLRVRGEIEGFEKSSFVRTYSVSLKTAEPKRKIICRVNPPEEISAVFTARQGEELIASTSSGSRATLARLGQTALIEGNCKGLKDRTVTLSGCRLVGVE